MGRLHKILFIKGHIAPRSNSEERIFSNFMAKNPEPFIII